MKGTIDIRRVITPARQRRVASRKRTLRRRSVRAARSVWSRPQSRVTEFRNFIVEVFPFDPGGTAPCRACMTKHDEARPESKSGAEGRVDVPGTWESLILPVRKESGLGRSRTKTSKVVDGVSATTTIKKTETGRVPSRKLNTSGMGSKSGSLSSLIVAFESRVTLPEGACE